MSSVSNSSAWPRAQGYWQRLCSGRLGAGWMVVASLFFALMSVCVKFGAASFGSVELLFYRTLFGALCLGAMMRWRGDAIVTPLWRGHLKRSVIGYGSMYLLFYAITHLPLATAVTLNYTSSLFFALVCLVRLREPLTRSTVAALVLGFAGIVLLLRPTISADAWFAAGMGLGSGACAGMALFQVRELGQMGEAPSRVVFWFFAISSLIGFVLIEAGQGFSPVTPVNVWPLLGVGLAGMLGQLAMTRAFKEGRKYLVASFAYLTVALTTLFGVLLWGDVLSFGGVLAIVLIIFSGLLAAQR
ncbi:DMT family transporter [Crenobacter sp. SG2305]|uniref:DMT family transporter n=1 Tax=Crenobacter oryzisoli TaxID=3056844 RepID=UPI0025AABEE5|nr:DMT family transporter [Crenobacter sp. SG2305]MDN0084982.1 DMT family transporter [Crenobacter sp. SG2305]